MDLVLLLLGVVVAIALWTLWRERERPYQAPTTRFQPEPGSRPLLPPEVDEKWPPSADWRTFFTPIAGVTHDGRQSVLRRLRPGDRLRLHREPDNPHDDAAIRIYGPAGQDCGFVPSGKNQSLADQMDRGADTLARVREVYGGEAEKPTLGCSIEIAVLSITVKRRLGLAPKLSRKKSKQPTEAPEIGDDAPPN